MGCVMGEADDWRTGPPTRLIQAIFPGTCYARPRVGSTWPSHLLSGGLQVVASRGCTRAREPSLYYQSSKVSLAIIVVCLADFLSAAEAFHPCF